MAKMTLATAATVLGVSVNATPEQVKKAFRGLSMKYHPDKVSPEEKEKAKLFPQIVEAHEVFEEHFKKQRENARAGQSTGNRGSTQRPGAGASRPTGGAQSSTLIQWYWQEYQKIRKIHEDHLNGKIKPARIKKKNLEDALKRAIDNKNLDLEIQLTNDLNTHLILYRSWLETEQQYANLEGRALVEYQSVAARGGRGG